MKIEEQIGHRLRQGVPAAQLVGQGFRKSTVYKVLDSLRAPANSLAPTPLVTVHMTTNSERYLPGATVQATFTLTNNSGADMYIFQAGVRPEWISRADWIATTIRKLLGAGGSMQVRLNLAIPEQTTLGDKELLFGIQGQWVGPLTNSPSSELMWSSPMILKLQRPPIGIKVFITHAVFDPSLIAQLATTLEDNGVEAAIGDWNSATVHTTEIEQAHFLVAVLSDPSRMESALADIAHAQSRKKDLILLRDASLAAMVPAGLASLGWIDLDYVLGAGAVMLNVFNALNDLIAKKRQKEQSDAFAVILMALGALVAGISIARGKPPVAGT
jgi:hypothetical protein